MKNKNPTTKPEAYLILHGNSGSHREMESLLPLLRSGVKVFNPDLPQHGSNIMAHFPLSIESCASWLQENLALEDYRLTIVGFSDGANIAMTLMKWGDLEIQSVLLLAPNLTWKGLTLWTRFMIRAGSLMSCPGSWIPALRRVGQRMSMMSEYHYQGEIKNIPETVLLVYGSKEMITLEEQQEVSRLLGVEPIILEGVTHMGLPQAGALENIFKSNNL